jgi:hypothetical protein
VQKHRHGQPACEAGLVRLEARHHRFEHAWQNPVGEVGSAIMPSGD